MNPPGLHSVTKTVYPRQANRLKLSPRKKHPDVEPRSFHAALIKKWGLPFASDPPAGNQS
jgi:hypothetical protein